MALFTGLLSGAVDTNCRQALENNKHYKKAKADLDEYAEYQSTVGKVAAFIGIGSIVLTFLGIGYCAARRQGTGEILVCAAVPLAIVSYDCYQASENFRSQVREKPEELMALGPANKPIPLNVVALKKCLLNKTLFFEPLMEYFFEDFFVSRQVKLATKC
jgi:hypothetical protein